MPVKAIEWINGKVRILDQTKLPTEVVYVDIDNPGDLGEAIRSLRVRGAPAIGIAGAFGIVLGIQNFQGNDVPGFLHEVDRVARELMKTRPTAVNLFWALERMKRVARQQSHLGVEGLKNRLLREAQTVLEEDREVCHRIGKHGARLLQDNSAVLTHCNAGALATGGFGTALGVVYAAVEEGKRIRVYVDETRPLLQGARLTTWELMQAGIDVTLISDNAAAFVLKQGRIDAIIVGADRIARNGDVANKIGTYNLAVLAEKHGIPFYVAAPLSSFDFSIQSGDQIPIEERAPEEITEGFGQRIAPPGVQVYSPAFDVTPHQLVRAIITEEGIIEPPFEENIAKLEKQLIHTQNSDDDLWEVTR